MVGVYQNVTKQSHLCFKDDGSGAFLATTDMLSGLFSQSDCAKLSMETYIVRPDFQV